MLLPEFRLLLNDFHLCDNKISIIILFYLHDLMNE